MTAPGEWTPEAPARPLRRDAERNRLRLVKAATEVFSEQGLDAGVDEVARRAGVGMGTLYRRFPTKDALVTALITDLLVDLLGAAREAVEEDGGTGHGLERFLRRTAGMQARYPGLLPRLWFSDGVTELRDALRDVNIELLERAQAAGTVRVDLTQTDVILILWSLRGIIEMSGPAAGQAVQRHLDIVLAGLRPSGAPLSVPPLTRAQTLAADERGRAAQRDGVADDGEVPAGEAGA